MLPESAKKTISQKMDHLVLYAMNRQIPDSLDSSYDQSISLEEVLSETTVDRRLTAVYMLTAPGEHPVWLNSPLGPILCHIKTRLAVSPQAPLLLYHHGLSEIPYTGTWDRLLPKTQPFPIHSVCVQAPFHNNFFEPFKVGFSSVRHIYQMFAGSMRVMKLVQEQFESAGAAFTTVSGISWGGITSLLYDGIFQSSRATIPMYSSPNLAQLLWDVAGRLHRHMPVTREMIDDLFDFTCYYNDCEQSRIFPIMGENDQFFLFNKHAQVFPQESMLILKSAHVGALWWVSQQMRERVLEIMKWAAKNPR